MMESLNSAIKELVLVPVLSLHHWVVLFTFDWLVGADVIGKDLARSLMDEGWLLRLALVLLFAGLFASWYCHHRRHLSRNFLLLTILMNIFGFWCFAVSIPAIVLGP